MDDLIAALTIFRKYQNRQNPTHCEHDTMMIMGITQNEVTQEDQTHLDELGFLWSESEGGCWISFRYGSA